MAVVLTPPDTNNVNVSGVEDQPNPITVPFSGTDDGQVTSFRVVISLPQHGILKDGAGNVLTIGSTVPATGNAANVFYYPNANWSGTDTFQYAARDNSSPVSLQDPTPATVTINVTPVNDPPTTNDTSASGVEDAAQILVTLSGADIDGTVQSFTINDLPANGTLKTTDGTVLNIGDTVPATGGTATVVFVPNEDWNGVTDFHYSSKDNENLDDATPATATITVTPVADPPETNDTHSDGQEDTPVAVNLSGSDPDAGGSVVSFTIKSLPANGVLKDANGNVLSVGSVVPAVGNAAVVYFHPDAQWNGDTEFDYASKDNTGLDDESPATATITIADVNDPPETDNTAASGVEDAPAITVHLSGSDIDGTVQTFTIKSLPANGTLTDLNGNPLSIGSTVTATDGQADVLFKPNANWTGDTAFNYASNDDDGLQDPTPAIATINVTPVNDPPETNNTSASGNEDGGAIAVNLSGSDVDGTVKLFTINSLPENGVLKDGNGNVLTVGSTVPATGNGATVYFTPNANWNGDTSFDYASRDNDDLDDATPATATITVASVNDAPDTGNSAATGIKGAVNIGLTLTGSDPDGTVVSFTIKSLPSNGVIKDANGNTLTIGSTVSAVNGQAEVFFTPTAAFTGVVNFNYASNDNEGLQDATPATGTVTITPPPAAPDPKPPETNNTSATGAEDVVKLAVNLTGSDPDGTVKQFVINTLPPNGKLYDAAGNLLSVGSVVTATGNAATVYFTPTANWNGVTTFNYASKDNDNLVDSTPAKATITITGV
ncbi:MAG: tandem-95 repeat protein, partial [Phenylobacterium sp.]|uniref:tandem-95 repeat protein n=1 Tax=Phenylobacterium sp. TaxID=1871053 RepID=UPI001A52FE30